MVFRTDHGVAVGRRLLELLDEPIRGREIVEWDEGSIRSPGLSWTRWDI
jgi:hypothetical protein